MAAAAAAASQTDDTFKPTEAPNPTRPQSRGAPGGGGRDGWWECLTVDAAQRASAAKRERARKGVMGRRATRKRPGARERRARRAMRRGRRRWDEAPARQDLRANPFRHPNKPKTNRKEKDSLRRED